MALAAGTRVGSYEIVSLLGAGGMGEVWRAHDSRLGRDVAIKVLPAGFAEDQERLRRFEQEARATAALNHPNILSIYDIGSLDGMPYLIEELLDGQSLRERIRRGPLPVARAVELAVQIASGLTAAHEKGIVHRDLKPENIFIMEDGHVKILDFGLAKLIRTDGGSLSTVATVSGTNQGTVLGTVGYMAPEQVRGQLCDHRADLFAFGCVLYEMISGQRAFHGATTADTLSAILNQEAPELAATGRAVPPALERIVRHCLEKSQAARFQSARDIVFALESLSSISQTVTTRVSVASPTRRGLLLAAVVAVAMLTGAAATLLLSAARHQPVPAMQRITYRRGIVREARFMPDGATILYSAAWEGQPYEVFTGRYDSSDSRPYGIQDAQVLSISSKSELALLMSPRPGAFLREAGTLATVDLGGSPRPLAENVLDADWSPDGSALAIVRQVEDGRTLEFPIDKVLRKGLEGPLDDYMPVEVRFSPDGQWLAFVEYSSGDPDYGRVGIMTRDGKTKVISGGFTTIANLAWSADGKEVWFTAAPAGGCRALYAIDLAGRQRLVFRAPGKLTLMDISRNGRVLLSRDEETVGIRVILPGQKAARDLSWYSWSELDDLSPDGSTILFCEGGEASQDRWSEYIRKTDGSPATRLGDGLFGRLSPDGKWAAVQSQWFVNAPSLATITLLPTGPGTPRLLLKTTIAPGGMMQFLPDATAIVFGGMEPGKPPRTWLLRLNETTPKPITPERVVGNLLTPDGKYVLAQQVDNQQRAFYPIAGGDIIHVKPFSGLIRGWHDDGRRLRVADARDPCKLSLVDPYTGAQEPWKTFTRALDDLAGVRSKIAGCPLMFTADGNGYASKYGRQLSELYEVEGLK